MRGGVDAIHDGMTRPAGLGRFAPATPARARCFRPGIVPGGTGRT
jgi:hypothetical protein